MTKRLVFFAHYDRDDLIDDYVLHYLKGLKPVCDKIIFASDSNLSKKETDKLKGLAVVAHAKHHGEYDFGSWKRCLQHLEKDLDRYDELVLANDSCFAPFHPFKSVFETMAKKDLDVWGLSKGRLDYKTHLDSYFIVLKKSVFLKKWFLNFMHSIQKQKNVVDVVKYYESGFSALLRKHSVKYDSYAPVPFWDLMARGSFHQEAFNRINTQQFPTLKTKILKQNIGSISRIKEKLDALNSTYPKKLYENYIHRICGTKTPRHYFIPVSSFKFPIVHKRILYIVAKTTKSYKWYRIMLKVFGIPLFLFYVPLFRVFR